MKEAVKNVFLHLRTELSLRDNSSPASKPLNIILAN